MRYLRKWFRQCNLSFLNLPPHTIAYLLILYLQSTYPKIANLILILYIACRALGCFKGGPCETFAIDVIQISTTRRAGFNWCKALARLIHLWGPLFHCCEKENEKRQSICENWKIALWKYCHYKVLNHYWSAHDHCVCCCLRLKSVKIQGIVGILLGWRERIINCHRQTNRNRHNWKIWQNTWSTFFIRITSVFSYLC